MGDNTQTERRPAIELVIRVNHPKYKPEAEEFYKALNELVNSDTAKKAIELDPELAFSVSFVSAEGDGTTQPEKQPDRVMKI